MFAVERLPFQVNTPSRDAPTAGIKALGDDLGDVSGLDAVFRAIALVLSSDDGLGVVEDEPLLVCQPTTTIGHL